MIIINFICLTFGQKNNIINLMIKFGRDNLGLKNNIIIKIKLNKIILL